MAFQDLPTDEELDLEDDYESDELEDVADAGRDYLRGMWSGYGWGGSRSDQYRAAVIAHGMVQTFVNAFARDGHYVVVFDPDTKTAGTDMEGKIVTLTPAPIADPNITPEEAGEILTGLGCHEICHPRYGRQTWNAVNARFAGNGLAFHVSNVLDDIRIERRFVADYPGYAGIFKPTLDYVGRTLVRRGGKKVRASMADLANLMVLATRYPDHAEWDEATSAEATWWTDWADRWAKEDAPKRHVVAVREALLRIIDRQAKTTPGPDGLPRPGAGQASNAKSDKAIRDAAESESGDARLNRESQEAQAEGETARSTEGEPTAPDCSGSSAVEDAAKKDGASRADISDLRQNADAAITEAANLHDDGHGGKVDVAVSLRGIASGRCTLGPSEQAAAFIRNAILRSRTGNTDVARHQSRGRLDQRGLARIATGDARLFERRRFPSPGKYNVWVMVDCSSSMMGYTIEQASQVAHAMAAATTRTPSVRMTVWGWSNPFRPSSGDAGVARVWTTGQKVDEVFRLPGLQMGGTPDGTTISWAGRAIKRETRSDETPVIIFISDGAGEGDMDKRVAEVRAMGVVVASVSFGYGLPEAAQIARFGKGNVVPFAGNIIETARGLGQLFARITSGR